MDDTIKNILGLHEEKEGGKLSPGVVVYLKPGQIGDDAGAHCGGCIFFNTDRGECFLTSPPACNAEKGVCSTFLGGESIFQAGGTPLKLLSKEEAGYIEEGPTKCSVCEYWVGSTKDDPNADPQEKGSCEKVDGKIYAGGCCNRWEKC